MKKIVLFIFITLSFQLPICIAGSNFDKQTDIDNINSEEKFKEEAATFFKVHNKEQVITESEYEQLKCSLKNFIDYANKYYSPNTFELREKIANQLWNEEVDADASLSAEERDCLKTCFGYDIDNYYTLYFGYNQSENNDILIITLYKKGSKNKLIAGCFAAAQARLKSYILDKKIKGIIEILQAPYSDEKKDIILNLQKDFNLFKQLMQEIKRKHWITYRLVDSNLGYGNQVYPGAFKPFVSLTNITVADDRLIKTLTLIARYWQEEGLIPQEPSYDEQKLSQEIIGAGCSVAWALLRYAVSQRALVNGYKSLSFEDKKLLVDDLLIRYGDRKRKILEAKKLVEFLCRDLSTIKLYREHGVKTIF